MVFCSFLTVVIFFRSHNSVEIKVFLTFLPVDGRIRLNNYGSGSRRPNNLQILSLPLKKLRLYCNFFRWVLLFELPGGVYGFLLPPLYIKKVLIKLS
jgi:hypothetical protein